MRKSLFYFIFLLFIQNSLYSQDITSSSLDSLVTLKFEELDTKFHEIIKIDLLKGEPYAKAYLLKGKHSNDVIKTAKGFHLLARIYDYKKSITYLDSAIAITKNIHHKRYPVVFYANKGVEYENIGIYSKALDNYFDGLASAKKTNNALFIAIFKHNIALLKRKLGKFKEAKSIFKECLTYERSMIGKKKNDTVSYLVTLSELITAYRQNKEIDSALVLNTEGLRMSKGTDIECLFTLNKGLIYYHTKNYKNAIHTLHQGLDELLNSKRLKYYEKDNLINGYLFLGKSYVAVSKKEVAITYFIKLDSLIQKTNYFIPDARSVYTEIIDYYKSIGDKNKQLYYINRLLYKDSIQNINYKYMSDRIIKDYDTPILLDKKEKLITELKTKQHHSNYGLIISLIILLLITILLVLNYRKSKQYRIRFNELMQLHKTEEKLNNEIVKKPNDSIGIDAGVVETILKSLEKFENNKGFLKKNITSGILAKNINTNSKYLTKVIKYHRNKNFTHYINDLRIDYIIQELKTNTKLQKYTIKALAIEAGFNSTEVFSKSFHKKTGIYPSYFIKRIQSSVYQ
ncbi:AraC family transcriptional regulator [Aquimarina longa]|uniref:AraC family transcriptional regulator n=1 Tax=Aquimarina longa TaxID=1080221 RepID=UPI000AD4E52B|nr:AraC family transcriptional regulator [Aquimarina longa]